MFASAMRTLRVMTFSTFIVISISFVTSAESLSRPRARLLTDVKQRGLTAINRSEEHTSELQSLMRISYAVFCLKKKNTLPHKHTARSTLPEKKKIQRYQHKYS